MLLFGLIVNPIAGMGGRVGLKGTDGSDILEEAVNRGAVSWAPERVHSSLLKLGKVDVNWVTWGGDMGENILEELGYDPKVLGSPVKEATSASDTREAAHVMMEYGVDLIVFAGGDGTAADIIEVVGTRVPVLGIPSGVKMFSGVFAATPAKAAEVLLMFLRGETVLVEREVMDIDEEAYREGRLSASLRGIALTPYVSSLIQNGKDTAIGDNLELMKESIAARIVEEMRSDAYYVLGPGSTVTKIAEFLGVEKTVLGIDVLFNRKLVAVDVDERTLLEVVKSDAFIILSPLGGQGTLLGRGNQPISPTVLRKVGLENIIAIATPQKLLVLKTLSVDTGDSELDSELRGYRRVIVGYHETKVMEVV